MRADAPGAAGPGGPATGRPRAGRPVSPETLESIRDIHLMLTFLAEKYKDERDTIHPH